MSWEARPIRDPALRGGPRVPVPGRGSTGRTHRVRPSCHTPLSRERSPAVRRRSLARTAARETSSSGCRGGRRRPRNRSPHRRCRRRHPHCRRRRRSSRPSPGRGRRPSRSSLPVRRSRRRSRTRHYRRDRGRVRPSALAYCTAPVRTRPLHVDRRERGRRRSAGSRLAREKPRPEPRPRPGRN